MIALPAGKQLRRTLSVVALAGFALVLALILHFILNRPIQSSPAPHSANATALPKSEKVNYGLPVRLKIPIIDVDAAVEHVGLTSQGDMDTPKDPTNAGWFNQGPHPGDKGSSVIDGHFGWENSIPAVFDNLHRLQKGDKLHVEDEKGTITTFIVREFQTYGPNDDAAGIFSSSDGKAHLNLITCQGAWNTTQQSYATRLVVFADKEKE